MLYSIGHGARIVVPTNDGTESHHAGNTPGTKSVAEVAPGLETIEMDAMFENASFGYMCPDAAGDARIGILDAFEALATAMLEVSDTPAEDSDIPPLFTYLGQFIDHDITANTDRDAPMASPISVVTGDDLTPLERDDVTSKIMNLRKGSLGLDSLYGEGPTSNAFSDKVKNAMRDPADRAKMRVGDTAPVPGFATVPFPASGKADLPRLGDVLDDPQSGLTEADIDALADPDLKANFKKGTEVQRWNAVIGDGRNDENLLVAQLHLAFLHFHNAVADSLTTEIPDADARFAEAKKRTVWYYQWLVVNQYLEKVCDPAVVAQVKSSQAPFYRAFKARVSPTGAELPLPLEFSVAAFRFGHSMVRAAYDHNSNFGRPADGGAKRASFQELFSFTGGDKLGMTAIGIPFDNLPSNWPIEWDRFAKDVPDAPDQRARKIDTRLALPLGDMIKEGGTPDAQMNRILRQLAERNLRRAYRLNIPTAQGVLASINDFDSTESANETSAYYPGKTGCSDHGGGDGITALTADELNSGPAGQAIAEGGFTDATPLWYYILREAELAGGNHLGVLGSRLIAETLIGLLVEDPTSYWHKDAGDGSWHPSDLPIGSSSDVVGDLPTMLQVAGVMGQNGSETPSRKKTSKTTATV